MKLEQIIEGLDLQTLEGDTSIDIGTITFDSRSVDKGCLFVAIRGSASDGHAFIQQAIQSGAAAVVCEEMPLVDGFSGIWIQVPDSRRALSLMASSFYGHPSKELLLVGITGTNGKTTIATLLYQLHMLQGFKAGLLSTNGIKIGEHSHPATHTTPDPIQINASIRAMVEAGCEYCFMEVSSHAIDQERIGGLDFNGGVFTNLSRDHLDYHKDFREYLEVKKRFFDRLPSNSFALVNADDKNGKVMLQNCEAEKQFYSLRSLSDFRGKILEMHLEGTSMTINDSELWVKPPGRFNASNMLCVYAVAVLLGMHPEDAIAAVSQVDPVAGRFETIRSGKGTTGIVDYAHTPDALLNVLETIQEVNVGEGEIITIVGAGGNRDRGKRSQMARIASEASDKVILTSDNPRDEDPEQILDEMMQGIPLALKDRTLRIVSREEAIRTACLMAGKTDIILLAGKGHENYQEIKGKKIEFNDMQILKKNLN